MARRFPNRRAIARVIRNGRRIAVPLGRALILPAADPEGRILFVVSKAVSKKSTARNRIRRVLTEWARTEGRSRTIGHDIVIFVHPGTGPLAPRAIRERARRTAALLFPERRR